MFINIRLHEANIVLVERKFQITLYVKDDKFHSSQLKDMYVVISVNVALYGRDGGLVPMKCVSQSLILGLSKDCPNVNVEMLFLLCSSH